MINRFWRENVFVSGLLALIRVYLGWQWMTSGWSKITTGSFDPTGYLQRSVDNPVLETGTGATMYPTYVAFLENFALPNAVLFKIVIPWGELLVGIGLILGCLTTAAAFFGLVMNFMFLFSGSVSSNPWYALLGLVILAAGANAGRFGADYYVLPYLRGLFRIKPFSRKEPIQVSPQI